MRNDSEQNVSRDEQKRDMISGLAIGAVLGVVFWSALDELLSFPYDLAVGMVTGLFAGYRWGKQPPPMLMRYPPGIMRRVLFSGVAFILGLFGYLKLLDLELNETQKLIASFLAIFPTFFFIVMVGLAIGSLDEMQRRIQTEGLAIAFAGTALVVIVSVFLSMAGVPSLNLGLLLVVMTFMWLIGKLWTMWRYK